MKEEKVKDERIIITTTILNFIVAVIKLVAGIMFSFSTLIADSIQSFTDFITDITCLIANRIGKRRANKTYPFGYGQVYAVANLFTGLLLFFIGVFIVYQFFFFEGEVTPDAMLFEILMLLIVLKSITVYLLQHFGTFYKSEIMIESSKESLADLVSTCVILAMSLIILLLDNFNIYINIDKIGSLGIAIYVFYTSIKMIIYNIKEILTNAEENAEINEEVKSALEKIKEIDLKQLRTIKMSTYYSVFIKVKVDEDITIKQFLGLEKKIKRNIKNKNKAVRFIDIEPV